MKNNWKKYKFKEFVNTNPTTLLKRGEEYSFIPMELVDGFNKVPVKIFKKKYAGGGAKFSDEDTIFARITPCLQNGKIAFMKNLEDGVGFGSTEYFVFRAIEDISDPHYIYYLARTEIIRGPAEKSMVGASGRQRANKSSIENLEIQAPLIKEQQKIASILSSHDDLIEINNRRIKILEEIAQRIYEEWFVNFKFPHLRQGFGGQAGYEEVKIKNGIPEGWEGKELKNIVNVKSGFAFKSSSFNKSGEWGLVTIKNVQDGNFINKCTDHLLELPEKIKGYCIINKFGNRGSRIGCVNLNGYRLQGFGVCQHCGKRACSKKRN